MLSTIQVVTLNKKFYNANIYILAVSHGSGCIEINNIYKEGLKQHIHRIMIISQQLRISLYTIFIVHFQCARSTRSLAELAVDHASQSNRAKTAFPQVFSSHFYYLLLYQIYTKFRAIAGMLIQVISSSQIIIPYLPLDSLNNFVLETY